MGTADKVEHCVTENQLDPVHRKYINPKLQKTAMFMAFKQYCGSEYCSQLH